MEKLYKRGIKAVATVRRNKKHLPKLKTDGEMKAGEVRSFVQKNGKVSFVQWKDKRCICLLSNYLPPESTTKKKRRVKGSAEKQDVDIPVMVAMYARIIHNGRCRSLRPTKRVLPN